MELILHGLAEFNIINKEMLDEEIQFKDYLADMLDNLDRNDSDGFDDEDDDEDDF
jgi:magnesium chelatase subunit I